MGATPASLATSLRVMAPLPRLERFVVSFTFMVCSRWRRYQKNRALFIRLIVNVSERQRTSIRAAQAERKSGSKGKRVSVSEELGGRRISKKKKRRETNGETNRLKK